MISFIDFSPMAVRNQIFKLCLFKTKPQVEIESAEFNMLKPFSGLRIKKCEVLDTDLTVYVVEGLKFVTFKLANGVTFKLEYYYLLDYFF